MEKPYLRRDQWTAFHLDCAACAVVGCDATVAPSGEVCALHEGTYPPALVKAACDPFDYALRLVTGEVVYFGTCQLHGDWVHVQGLCADDDRRHSPHGPGDLPIGGDRGVHIRVEHIVWCADAPNGS
jgi:hypothetical protein